VVHPVVRAGALGAAIAVWAHGALAKRFLGLNVREIAVACRHTQCSFSFEAATHVCSRAEHLERKSPTPVHLCP
jgi:hypothetical protein